MPLWSAATTSIRFVGLVRLCTRVVSDNSMFCQRLDLSSEVMLEALRDSDANASKAIFRHKIREVVVIFNQWLCSGKRG